MRSAKINYILVEGIVMWIERRPKPQHLDYEVEKIDVRQPGVYGQVVEYG